MRAQESQRTGCAHANLLKHGKRDKFEAYRDIRYYSVINWPRRNRTPALRSTTSTKSKIQRKQYKPPQQHSLQLGDIAYDRKQYRLAAAMYDSLMQTGADSVMDVDRQPAGPVRMRHQDRRSHQPDRTEDSLQHIALMQPAERDDFAKKLVKRLRKAS